MNTAKLYIYRNLHKQTFSIRHNGKVIKHAKAILIDNATLKVNEAGRKRVIQDKQKNVHAFATVDSINDLILIDYNELSNTEFVREVTYNPYKNGSFVYTDTGEPCYHIDSGIMVGGKVYHYV